MAQATVYSIVETPLHPDFSTLYAGLGYAEQRFNSMRKAIAALARTPPDWVVAEFLYGYGNNYAGVNISNLDVFLYSLQKYAPGARVIVLVDKREREHVAKLEELFALHAVLVQPVSEEQLRKAINP